MCTYRPAMLLVASLLVAVCAYAADQSTKESSSKKPASKILTLSGCIDPDQTTTGRFVLSDAKSGPMYRLSGTDLREYLGKRVQVSGVAPRRVQVVTGLYPTPNIAAQAGAIDPARAAVAAATAAPAGGGKPLPEFRVRAVKAIAGTCPQR